MRKRSAPTFKALVVWELLTEDKAPAQLAADYAMRPSLLVKEAGHGAARPTQSHYATSEHGGA
jgi:hypothetical protein